MYEGMSYIQLYRNRKCTERIPQDFNGNYLLALGVVSSNVSNPYVLNIFSKNIGTHKAYDVNITITLGNATSIFTKCDVLPNQVKTIPLSISINKNQTIQEIIIVKLEFDSV